MDAKADFVTAEELEHDAPENDDYVVKRLIYAGSITEIVGKPKVGKSRLLLELCRAALDGNEFVGCPTRGRPAVVYLTEQPRRSFRKELADAGLRGRPNFHVLIRVENARLSWQDVVVAAVALAHKLSALLVVDTFTEFARVPGDGENSAGAVLAAIEPLQRATVLGIPIAISHHERKGGGEITDASRGSSALTGAVDTVLVLRRPEGNQQGTVRRIDGLSRFGEVPSLFIELTDTGYVSHGGDAAVTTKRATEALLAAIPESPREVMRAALFKDLKEAGFMHTSLGAALNDLVAQGQVFSKPVSGRGNPIALSRRPIGSAASREAVPAEGMASAVAGSRGTAGGPGYLAGTQSLNSGEIEGQGVTHDLDR